MGPTGIWFPLTFSGQTLRLIAMTVEKPAREKDEPYLQIGEVSDRTGVTQRTLRFYEERGLLAAPTRMDGGFRLYSEEDVERVSEIRRLQNLLNLSLAEIKEMVDAQEFLSGLKATYRPDLDPAERLQRLAGAIEVTERQREIISDKLKALKTMKHDLEARIERFRTSQAEVEQLLAGRKK
jgi:DNA-binding transcriptional MerR regulator